MFAIHRLLPILFLLFLAGLSLSAGTKAYRDEVKTPHWQWEEHHIGGTVRALFLTPSLAVREPEELAQRFDLKADVLGVSGQPPNGLKMDQNKLAAFLKNDYDVIAIPCQYSADIWSQLTPENKKMIVDKTRNGATLVLGRGYGRWKSEDRGQFDEKNTEPKKKNFSRYDAADLLAEDATNRTMKDPDTSADLKDLVTELKTPKPAGPTVKMEEAETIVRALPAPVSRSKTESYRVVGPTYRGGLSLAVEPVGKGKVIYYYGTSGHFTSFNLFLGEDPNFGLHGNCGAFFDDPVLPEIFYAITARWLRAATKKESPVLVRDVKIKEKTCNLDQPTEIQLVLKGKPVTGDQLEWFLYSPFGDLLEQGNSTVSSGQTVVPISLTPHQTGRLTCRWKLERGEKTLDTGACFLPVDSSINLQMDEISAPVNAENGLSLSWKTEGEANEQDQVIVQIYDPDGRLVSADSFPATAGKGTMKAWIPRFISHKLRAVLLRKQSVLDEKRFRFPVRYDRKNDNQDFTINVWGFEGGMGVRQGMFRCRILRDTGITSISGNGGESFLQMAGDQGLRIALCNIFHPNARKNPDYDEKKAEEKLVDRAAETAPWSPIGYMLGDEPPPDMKDLVEYTDHAATLIHSRDPGARVGWSGAWIKFSQNAPAFLHSCTYLTAYSPHHLYTPNLWLGVERDLLRSFANPDGILSCWTHYAPWADNEPYSRTVPWLWLFEGMNGVSYFSSAGEFAVLPEDLRSSHETRWWSEEVKHLKCGIGKQLISMKRDPGSIRILFSRDSSNSDIWMRALNQLNVSYRLANRDELVSGFGKGVRLLICPDALDLTDQEVESLQKFLDQGGMVVATGPVGIMSAGQMTEAVRLVPLFGIERNKIPKTVEEFRKECQTLAEIQVEVQTKLPGQDEKQEPLTGATLGDRDLVVKEGQVTAEFIKAGDWKSGDDPAGVEFIKKIFSVPAMIEKKHASGTALYLAFQPDLESTKRLLPFLMKQAGVTEPSCRVTINGKPDDTVYLYPFSGDGIRMMGIIQDYWRVQPEWIIEHPESPEDASDAVSKTTARETALYYAHGPNLWTAKDAALHTSIPYYIYDSRNGTYLGNSAETKISLQPGRPELYALLPYQIKGLTISAPVEAIQGDMITIRLELTAENAVPKAHVIHLSLTAPDGTQLAADRWNLLSNQGKAEQKVQIPLNAVPGFWKIQAKDAVTGTHASVDLQVKETAPSGCPVLTCEKPVIHRVPLDWPEGRLVSYQEKEEKEKLKKEQCVEVKGASLKKFRLPRHWEKYENQKGLKADFTLSNKDAFYRMKYEVCNDAEANGWDDPRRIWTNTRPGLGISRPNPMGWFCNGYLEIWLDDFCAADFAVKDIQEIKDGNNGRVDVTFDTPYGILVLSFAMMPDHIGLFQQLEVRPTKPVKKVRLMFRRYDWGGKERPNSFITVDPEDKSWALTGDRVEDRALGKGPGPSGMLVVPGTWSKVSFTPPNPTLEKMVDLPAGGNAKFQWVLWHFPEFSNEKAHNYLRENSVDTRHRLDRIFSISKDKTEANK